MTNGGCGAGNVLQNGQCFAPQQFNGGCGVGNALQNGQCFPQQFNGSQGATCYAGYNQMGQCYSGGTTASNGQCNYGQYPDGRCY